ncbi:hypothetical protein [Peribacillus sp. Hz7]|uniref:hypothetical protein n=1 Tax=Peribacillus sp. Hz7 TaxID=3344873 RepID=UPI0035CA1CE9
MENSVAKILRIIGIVEIILGVILGFILGRVDVGSFTERYVQVWSTTFMWWIVGFISGMLIIGLSEVIELLHKINKKVGKDEVNETNEGTVKEIYTRKEAARLLEQNKYK